MLRVLLTLSYKVEIMNVCIDRIRFPEKRVFAAQFSISFYWRHSLHFDTVLRPACVSTGCWKESATLFRQRKKSSRIQSFASKMRFSLWFIKQLHASITLFLSKESHWKKVAAVCYNQVWFARGVSSRKITLKKTTGM